MNAAHIMTKNPATIQCGDTVGNAMNLLWQERLRQLPVLDKEHKVAGMLSSIRLLQTILPRYIAEGLLQDVKFAPDLPQFHRKSEELSKKDVCEVMDKDFVKIGPEVSVMEVATLFINREKPVETIVVVDNKDLLLGIIAPWDIFRVCEFPGKKR